jgi:protein-tyrosine-phosphatase
VAQASRPSLATTGGTPCHSFRRQTRLSFPTLSGYPRWVLDRVLFICTGNFYRSRFAEAVFNHLAETRKLSWRGISRGLAIHWAEGCLSSIVAESLEARGIDRRHTSADRVQLTTGDLEGSKIWIALDRVEHLPMMRSQFPNWADKIQYWEIGDVPGTSPENALPAIELKVTALIDHLTS